MVIDTSGSMSAADLAAALAEVSGVLKALAVGTVRVGCCDAAATELRPVASMREVNLSGGGGTDMRVGIAAALAGHPKPSVIIVLTDGDTPWPARGFGVPLIVVLIGATGTARAGVPGWARTVEVGPAKAAA